MISIVMPVYNAAPYLKECLDSILNQSYKDWELIAVNDYSLDTSMSILKEYAERDARILCFDNTEKGIIPALKLGYSKSSGEYITRMDADDIMPIEKLLLMYTKLQEDPKGVVTGEVEYFSDGELGDGYKKYERWLNNLVAVNSHYQEVYKECVIASPCWMMSKEQFEMIGAFESKQYPEDYDLCFRMYNNRIKVLPIKEVLHKWRDSSGRASRNDPNYSDNNFLKIKIDYFLLSDHSNTSQLFVWGAGKKGKEISKLLNKKYIDYQWVCNNENKIGHRINDVLLQSEETVFQSDSIIQVIISVANTEEQKQINERLALTENIEAYWFC